MPKHMPPYPQSFALRPSNWRVRAISRMPRSPVISRCPRALSFLDAQRPPVEPGGRADEIATPLQRDASTGLRVFQLLEIGEMAVDEDGVG